jgi:hypothetical protein
MDQYGKYSSKNGFAPNTRIMSGVGQTNNTRKVYLIQPIINLLLTMVLTT